MKIHTVKLHQQQSRGTIIITLVIAMTLMAVFGAGLYTMTSTSSFGQLTEGNNDDANNLAKAGLRYGIGLQVPNYTTTTFLMPDSNHVFTMGIVNGLITATGIVNPGTFMETQRALTYDTSWVQPTQYISTLPSSPIVNNPNVITPNPAAKNITMGSTTPNSYGSIWYQGSSQNGNCINGACKFGSCLYAYFDFTSVTEDFSAGSTANGEGFVFALISALNNTRDRTGGAVTGIPQGELLGYAGPGTTADKLGLKPPKIGFEFDTYPETGTNSICGANSRNDGTPFLNHMALLFWGNRTNAACGAYPGDSFDDNTHGAGGTGNDPLNPTKGNNGYYEGAGRTCKSSANACNWMEDGYPYSVRVEIARPLPDTATSGTFNYIINAWIVRPIDAGFTAPQTANFQNVMTPYLDSSPQISKTVTLGFQDHSDLSKIFFGFTEATGTATQQINLSNLRVNFPQGASPCTQAICIYSISPGSVTVGSGASAGTVGVTANTGCAWSATSNNAWVTVTGGALGTGNGTVSYSIAANNVCPKTQRAGSITIAGQTFTITQGGVAALSVTTASLPNGRQNVAYTATTMSATGGATPYTWSATGLPTGLSINASTGVISGTPTTTGLFSPIITVKDSCLVTANATYSVRIKPNTYKIYNNTGAVIYRKVGSTCTNANKINNGSFYSMAYNAAAVSFYKNGNTVCGGNTISISGAQADTADANFNGNVQINNAWSLIDQ